MNPTLLCKHQLFQQQAQLTPDAIAVVDGEKQLTYKELDTVTDQLAGYLQEQGVHFDDSVGVFMDTSIEYVIACIAALKAGGAYLPLDMAYPRSHLSKILLETQSKVIITKSEYAFKIDDTLPTTVLSIDTDQNWKSYKYNAEAVKDISLDHLAYIVYTSGTTGEPKGILAPHRGAVYSYFERYKIRSYKPGDRVACNIFFVWELFRALFKGATVYVIPDDVIYDPRKLVNFISENEINEVLFTPTLMSTVLNSIDKKIIQQKLSSLDVAWCNGEVVTTNLRERALNTLPEHVRLLNTYSISECHDVASFELKDEIPQPSGICRVGYPIAGIKVRLLNEAMQEVPQGEVGEIYVGGPCLARGYLNKRELTTRRFVEIEGERLYRTGDLAIQHSDGNLEIRGRCDSMIKIRGYSIVLGAVETALLEHAQVKSCAVIAEGAEGGEKRLVAYVVKGENAGWEINSTTGTCSALRDKLKPVIAEYMIPSCFVELEALPLNPTTGKLNQKFLPPPPEQLVFGIEDIILSPAATNEQQLQTMRTLWERILGLQAGIIKSNSNFFDFGGHSLLAAKLTIGIETIFMKQVSVKDVYEYPTVKELVNYMYEYGQKVDSHEFMKDDIYLPETFTLSSNKKAHSLQEAKHIFLTGSTGFLGAFILEELLQKTAANVTIHCLVRAKDGQAEERLKHNLLQFGLWQDRYQERIQVVVGDLSKPSFGLTSKQFESLCETIDFIFHSAAFVNYVYPYSLLKPATVDGTKEIIRLASTSYQKPLYYISTNGVFPGGDSEPYREDKDIDQFAQHLSNGYGQSKWVAEKLVWQASEKGLPVCVFRPGNIGHHSVSGAVNPNDFQFHIIDASRKVKSAPDNKNWAFEMTPVDFLVKAIVRFAYHGENFGKVYNVVENNPIAAQAIFDHLLEKKAIDKFVPLETWTDTLSEQAKTDKDYLLDVLAQSLKDVEGYLADTSIYDCSQFSQAVEACGLKKPEPQLDYFEPFFQRHLGI